MSNTIPHVISRFSGEWSFLSNFYQSGVNVDGHVYPSAEHAFQAAKTDNPWDKNRIANSPTSGAAKAIGRAVTLVDGWHEYRRYDAMEYIIVVKFLPGSELAGRLIATEPATLIEGNSWHDNDWGICYCGRCKDGRNLLGWMLMRHRASLVLGEC